MSEMVTISLRLRDKHGAELTRQSRAVNFVWNFCNETQQKAARSGRKWLTGFDLVNLTSGSSKELRLNAQTINQVCLVYERSRRAQKRSCLRWRGRRSLGWIPFHSHAVRFDGERFRFGGVDIEPMHLRKELTGAKFGCGSFSADSRGRWYINIPIQRECAASAPNSRIGVDLGLKDLAALSTGAKIEAPRLFRASEERLATAQRARKTKRARAIHAKVANRRRDFLHKASARITKEHGLIVVGDVSPSRIAQTRLAKSVRDAGWADFKRMLTYKSHWRGGACIEIDERYTSQVCSNCGSLPNSRPKGIADLGKRVWQCDDCGTVHDRDVNAACNILRVGLDTLLSRSRESGAVNSPSRECENPLPVFPARKEENAVA